ncbi:MAG: hypothetical protein J5594_01955 [Elusimicrobiaceae bacterium]|nr:hypothetical protein [Elusimicrobiaceae bacterium]
MNNKGYTIMEAVVAMFLIVVMVGAVFSALMSGRRAIVTSSEREEVLYSIQSAYGMLKDCRNNDNCQLGVSGCEHLYSGGGTTDADGYHDLKTCGDLFTFNFNNLCKDDPNAFYKYRVLTNSNGVNVSLPVTNSVGSAPSPMLANFFDLEITTNCSEPL